MLLVVLVVVVVVVVVVLVVFRCAAALLGGPGGPLLPSQAFVATVLTAVNLSGLNIVGTTAIVVPLQYPHLHTVVWSVA